MTTRRRIASPGPLPAPAVCGLLIIAALAPACEPEHAAGDGAMPEVEGLATTNAAESGGDAVVKFCHRLVSDRRPIELELRIGPISLKAATNTCSPVPGQDCQSLSPGQHQVTLLRGNEVLAQGPVDVAEGQSLIAYAEMNKKEANVNFIAVKSAAACASAVKPRSPPPPAAPPGSITCWAEGTYQVCDSGVGGYCRHDTVRAFGFGATRIEAETWALSSCGDHVTGMIIANNIGSSSASLWWPCHITSCF